MQRYMICAYIFVCLLAVGNCHFWNNWFTSSSEENSRSKYLPYIGIHDALQSKTECRTVRCYSYRYDYDECALPYSGQAVSIKIKRQISNQRCLKGYNYGLENNQIWVDWNCKAEFKVCFSQKKTTQVPSKPTTNTPPATTTATPGTSWFETKTTTRTTTTPTAPPTTETTTPTSPPTEIMDMPAADNPVIATNPPTRKTTQHPTTTQEPITSTWKPTTTTQKPTTTTQKPTTTTQKPTTTTQKPTTIQRPTTTQKPTTTRMPTTTTQKPTTTTQKPTKTQKPTTATLLRTTTAPTVKSRIGMKHKPECEKTNGFCSPICPASCPPTTEAVCSPGLLCCRISQVQECGAPPYSDADNPNFSITLSGTEEGDEAVYRCAQGSNKGGEQVLVCENGSWGPTLTLIC